MKFPDHTLTVNVATDSIAWLTFEFGTTDKVARPITLARVSDEIAKWMEENRADHVIQEMKFSYPTMEDEYENESLDDDAPAVVDEVPTSDATITPGTRRESVNSDDFSF